MKRREQAERLLDGIGEIRERYIEEAAEIRKHWSGAALRALAAVLAVVILSPFAILLLTMRGAGSSGGADTEGIGNVYDLYDGPIMALEALGDSGGITVKREVIFDFSPYESREKAAEDGTLYNDYERMAYVSDNYVLTNSRTGDVTLELAYPVLDRADALADKALTLLVDGEQVRPTYGSSMAVVDGSNWKIVRDLLTDEQDKAQAMSGKGLGTDSDEHLYYARFQVTIPAHGTLNVSFQMKKGGSWLISGGNNAEYRGYEILPTLGSQLRFTEVRATLISYDRIGIVDQSCGFDLEKGISSVRLHTKQPEYYFNVERD